ncbi:MAG: glycosyltransferase [Candidatus Eiseniibacteriota bacterium]
MARRAAIVLTSRLPWPLDDGGRIASWQTVWAAAQAWDVTLLSFVPLGTQGDPLPKPLVELGVTVGRVPHLPPAKLWAAARGAVGRWPYTLARYQSDAFRRALRERVAVVRPAYVLATPLHMAPYVEDVSGVPFVLREHNVEHVWMARYARSLGSTPAGLYARLQARRLRFTEARLCRAAALTLSIQDQETDALRRVAPGARVETLPLGIDLDRHPKPAPSAPPAVLLAASFAWEPNVAGAIRFLEEGWPRVRAGAPSARLRLAGKNPPERLAAAVRRAGAELAADVSSMPEEFARATVLLVPLWVGAGARVKIIEAFAARLPVIATPEACEGLDVIPGTHFLSGATTFDLADRVLEALRGPSLRDRLAREGRALAEERWSLPAVARLQNERIEQAIER